MGQALCVEYTLCHVQINKRDNEWTALGIYHKEEAGLGTDLTSLEVLKLCWSLCRPLQASTSCRRCIPDNAVLRGPSQE